MKRLARLGARARLDELEAERRAIMRAFPGVARPRGGEAPGPDGEDKPKRARKRRPKMTAAQRKAQSDRMKKLWAERRKAQ